MRNTKLWKDKHSEPSHLHQKKQSGSLGADERGKSLRMASHIKLEILGTRHPCNIHRVVNRKQRRRLHADFKDESKPDFQTP